VYVDESVWDQAKECGLFTKPRGFSKVVNMALKYFLKQYKKV